MKATLTFTLPDDEEEFQTAVDGHKYKAALWEVSQKIFRPARKHGYSDAKVQDLLDKADETTVAIMDDGNCKLYDGCVGTELVAALEKLFYEILQEEGIEL